MQLLIWSFVKKLNEKNALDLANFNNVEVQEPSKIPNIRL